MNSDCIFCNIISGKSPAHKIFEDKNCIVILDIFASNSGHSLIIPKDHYENLYEIPDDLLSKLHLTSKKLALVLKSALSASGINIIQNNEKAAGQSAMHYHIHVIPRFELDEVSILYSGARKDSNKMLETYDLLKNKL